MGKLSFTHHAACHVDFRLAEMYARREIYRSSFNDSRNLAGLRKQAHRDVSAGFEGVCIAVHPDFRELLAAQADKTTHMGREQVVPYCTAGVVLQAGTTDCARRTAALLGSGAVRVVWEADIGRHVIYPETSGARFDASGNHEADPRGTDWINFRTMTGTFREEEGDRFRVFFSGIPLLQRALCLPAKGEYYLQENKQGPSPVSLRDIWEVVLPEVSACFRVIPAGADDLVLEFDRKMLARDMAILEPGAPCLFDLFRQSARLVDTEPAVTFCTDTKKALFQPLSAAAKKCGAASGSPRPEEAPRPGRKVELAGLHDRQGNAVREAFFDRLSMTGTAQRDKMHGGVLVFGLTASLVPVPFTAWDWEEEHGQVSKTPEYDTQPDAVFARDTSWLSLKARVYVHITKRDFRFVFALPVRALQKGETNDAHFVSLRKRPLLFCVPHRVPRKGINTQFRQVWRGMPKEVSRQINAIPGLNIAMVSALNEARSQYAKLGDPNHFPGYITGQKPPPGTVFAFPGWGQSEVERMDAVTERFDPRDRSVYSSRSEMWRGFGGKDTVLRSDGPFGLHWAYRTTANRYRPRAKPYHRVLDVVKACLPLYEDPDFHLAGEPVERVRKVDMALLSAAPEVSPASELQPVAPRRCIEL